MQPPHDQPYEELAARLELITRKLEQGEVALEEAMSLYEEGVVLVRTLSRRLDKLEERIRYINEEGGDEEREGPFADERP